MPAGAIGRCWPIEAEPVARYQSCKLEHADVHTGGLPRIPHPDGAKTGAVQSAIQTACSCKQWIGRRVGPGRPESRSVPLGETLVARSTDTVTTPASDARGQRASSDFVHPRLLRDPGVECTTPRWSTAPSDTSADGTSHAQGGARDGADSPGRGTAIGSVWAATVAPAEQPGKAP